MRKRRKKERKEDLRVVREVDKGGWLSHQVGGVRGAFVLKIYEIV